MLALQTTKDDILSCSQELSRSRAKRATALQPVAVQQLDDAPLLLSEAALDSLTRTLSAGEWALRQAADIITDSAPRSRVSAATGITPLHNVGPFCLQEFVDTGTLSGIIVARFTLGSSVDNSAANCAANDRVPGSISLSLNPVEPLQATAQEIPKLDVPPLIIRKNVQAAISSVFHHLLACHKLTMTAATLEFALDCRKGTLALVSALAITTIPAHPQLAHGSGVVNNGNGIRANASNGVEVTNRDEISWEFALGVADERKPSHTKQCVGKSRNHRGSSSSCPRVCRQCRAPLDVELATELQRQQATLRSVVFKYQTLQETTQYLNQEREQAQSLIGKLQREVANLRRDRDEWHRHWAEVARQHHDCEETIDRLRRELREATESRQMALEDDAWFAAEDQKRSIISAEQVTREVEAKMELQHSELIRQWQTEWNDERRRDSIEVESFDDAEELVKHLRGKIERVRVERDELRFRWRYVSRHLTDTTMSGVRPPSRIGGGYFLYPSPSPENVRAVVKWILDYDTRKMVVSDGQKKRKSIAKRWKLKHQLMRALGSPGKTHASPRKSRASLSPSSPHKMSVSPRKSRALSSFSSIAASPTLASPTLVSMASSALESPERARWKW